MTSNTRPVCPYPAGDYDLRLSHTALLKARCLSAWLMSYHPDRSKRSEGISTEAMKRGRAVHDAVATIARRCVDRKTGHLPDREINEIYSEVCVGHKCHPSTMDDVAEILGEFLTNEHDWLDPDPATITGIEQPLWWIEEADGLRIAMLAKVDWFKVLDRFGFILDWKTSPRVIDDANWQRDTQMPIYAVALKANYPDVEVIDAVLSFVARSAETRRRRMDDGVMSASRRWIVQTGSLIQAGLKEMAAGVPDFEAFPPSPGDACAPYETVICPHILTCPFRQKLNVPNFADELEKKELVGAYAYTKALSSTLRGLVGLAAGDATAEKPLTGGGKMAYYAYGTETVYQPEAIRWLLDNGFSMEYLRVNGRKLPRNIRQKMVECGVAFEAPASDLKIVKHKE